MYMQPIQLVHVQFYAHTRNNLWGKALTKNYNVKFVSVTNEKATSKFHVPVQTPAFPCSQRSQGAVLC